MRSSNEHEMADGWGQQDSAVHALAVAHSTLGTPGCREWACAAAQTRLARFQRPNIRSSSWHIRHKELLLVLQSGLSMYFLLCYFIERLSEDHRMAAQSGQDKIAARAVPCSKWSVKEKRCGHWLGGAVSLSTRDSLTAPPN